MKQVESSSADGPRDISEAAKAATAPSDEIISSLGRLPTAVLSDALDSLGLHASSPGLSAVTPMRRFFGRAFTVLYREVGSEPGTVGDFIDDVPAGAVVVIDNQGRLDATVWGGLMSFTAARRGLAGTVINGVCRDIAEATENDYALVARGRHMRTGKDRVVLAGLQVPVNLGGVQVLPQDIIVADDDGVVVIPSSSAIEVLERASEIEEREQRIQELVAAGSALRDARAAMGYHELQRREG